METFSAAFVAPAWQHVFDLIVGAILSPWRRTVATALRVMGLDQDPCFTNYQRVLNGNRWSSLRLARGMCPLLVSPFVLAGPIVIGLDDTLERRWGAKIAARGIYRDPVRSSQGHFVKANGLRWLSVMLLPSVPWAGRVWGLPFLTSLAPSEGYASQRKKRHKKLTDWGRQVLLQAPRWLPDREIIAAADSSFAAIDLPNIVRRRMCMITRLRLDVWLFNPPARLTIGTIGRPTVIGKRQATLAKRLANPKTRWRCLQVTGWYGRGERLVEIVSGTALWHHHGRLVPIRYVLVRDAAGELRPQAFLCTDLDADRSVIRRICAWSTSCPGLSAAGRWRSPLPRCAAISASRPSAIAKRSVPKSASAKALARGSNPAIARTTPALLGLFSLVTLWAHDLYAAQTPAPRTAS